MPRHGLRAYRISLNSMTGSNTIQNFEQYPGHHLVITDTCGVHATPPLSLAATDDKIVGTAGLSSITRPGKTLCPVHFIPIVNPVKCPDRFGRGSSVKLPNNVALCAVGAGMCVKRIIVFTWVRMDGYVTSIPEYAISVVPVKEIEWNVVQKNQTASL